MSAKSAAYGAAITLVFVSFGFASQVKPRPTKQSAAATRSTSPTPVSALPTSSIGQERVAALSRRLAITSVPSLPQGATAATLSPGVTEPTLTFADQSSTSGNTNMAPTTAPTPTGPPVQIKRRAVMQTPSGYIATAPLNGLPSGSYVVVHSDGTVAASSPNGDVLWNHGSLEFTQWTGRYPPNNGSGDVVPTTPVVHLGLDPIDPFHEAGEHPFAVGDLTGDGIDDVAVAHFFSAVTAIGGTSGGTFVSVLDGSSGNLVWSQMYPGFVNNLAIEDGMLVVASETGNVRSLLGQNGSFSALDGWTFTNSGGTTQTTLAWSISTGAQWAPWLALEKLPNGKIAAAWTNSALGSGNATNGKLLVVSLATGATDWSVATTGYPRFLRFDASRNEVVSVEEDDPNSTYAYSIVARNLLDGSLAGTVAEANATALGFQIGDLDGDQNAEFVVADIAYVPCAPMVCVGIQNSGRVLAINGSTGAEEWSQMRGTQLIDPSNPLAGTDIPRPYGLLLTPTANGGDVLVASFIPGGSMELERLSGALSLNGPAGTVLWSQSSANLFLPLFISLYQQGGSQFVRTAISRARVYGVGQTLDGAGAQVITTGTTPFQVVRSFDASNGNQISAVPLIGRIHAAAGTRVNSDNTTDLVVGGESGAVFALDGNKIDDHPIVLWRKTVAGPVHQIVAADLEGDGRDEIIVAATHAVDVLDSATGNLRYEIPYASDFIWSVTVADVNGDGKIDIVVPGVSLTVYSGDTGALLWSYAPSSVASPTVFSNAVVTPERLVVAQYVSGMQVPGAQTGTGFTRNVAALNGGTGSVVWSASNQTAVPQLWQGTVGGQLDGLSSSVVGFTWIDKAGVTPALHLDLHDAATGALLNSLPPPSTFAGNFGSLLVPARGVVAYSYNFSWLVNTTEADQVLGYDVVQDLAEGNFGMVGHRVIEATQPFYLRVLHQNGPEPNSNSTASVAASYNHKISPSRLYTQDLDDDGIDEVIRVQWDWDGYSNLVGSTQGFGYEVTTYSDGLDILAVQPVPVQLTSAVSRKVHGSAGTFDVNLPLTGTRGVECRSGGTNSAYTMVFTFLNPVTNCGAASTGSLSSGPNPNQCTVGLTGVPNAQYLTVTLTGAVDSTGATGNVSGTMGVLVGDVNASGVVTSGDTNLCKAQALQPVTNANFRNDINASGAITTGDVNIIKQNALTQLPSPP